MACLVQLGIGTVRTRLPLPIRSTMTQRASRFDVSKDGRFLIPAVVEQAASVPLTVVLN
jgi:hypothetical protein